MCVGVCGSVCLCVCVNDSSKNNGSVQLKLDHIVVYENNSDEFDIGHCPIRSRSLSNFSPFTTIQTNKSYISTLAHVRKL